MKVSSRSDCAAFVVVQASRLQTRCRRDACTTKIGCNSVRERALAAREFAEVEDGVDVQLAVDEVVVDRLGPAAAGGKRVERLLHLVPPEERQRVRVGLGDAAVRLRLGAERGGVGPPLIELLVAE